MIRKLLVIALIIMSMVPGIASAQQDDCNVQMYVQFAQPLLDSVTSDLSPDQIDALRVQWHSIEPDACTAQHHAAVEYALSELYISALLKDSDSSLSQTHLGRYQEAWDTAETLYSEMAPTVEQPVSAQGAQRDGKSRKTAWLLGETGTILDGKGTLVIERVIRGATYRDASVLNWQQPDTGKEYLLLWVTFTCQQDMCDPIDKEGFFVVGDEAVVYGNLVYARGGYFDDQLQGQALNGGSVSGWLWFQVSKTDTGLVLLDNGDSARFFSLSAFPPGAEFVVVTGNNVNLRSCGSTDCNIVGQVTNGQQLMILGEESGWFHIRAENGMEGYIFGELVKRG
jgi:hypothetical protein